MKKHTGYYLIITKSNHAKYLKLENEIPFSPSEGVAYIKENHPNAVKVSHIAKGKAEKFLHLIQP